MTKDSAKSIAKLAFDLGRDACFVHNIACDVQANRNWSWADARPIVSARLRCFRIAPDSLHPDAEHPLTDGEHQIHVAIADEIASVRNAFAEAVAKRGSKASIEGLRRATDRAHGVLFAINTALSACVNR
jgi:hypothetical protein